MFASNRLAWSVFIAAYRGKQFLFAGLGGVVGFNYETVLKLIEFMVPADRRREVFSKFQIIEPFAIAQLQRASKPGGSDGAGSDSQAGGEGRRKRRPRTRS